MPRTVQQVIEEMKEFGYKTTDIAKVARASAASVKKWEDGGTPKDAKTLRRLSSSLQARMRIKAREKEEIYSEFKAVTPDHPMRRAGDKAVAKAKKEVLAAAKKIMPTDKAEVPDRVSDKAKLGRRKKNVVSVVSRETTTGALTFDNAFGLEDLFRLAKTMGYTITVQEMKS